MRSLYRARVFVCGAILGLTISSAARANFTCEGAESYLGPSPEGTISVSVGFSVWHLCNQTTPHGGNGGVNYSAEGCRAWFASILAAQMAGSQIPM
jgi:hypothetical protein